MLNFLVLQLISIVCPQLIHDFFQLLLFVLQIKKHSLLAWINWGVIVSDLRRSNVKRCANEFIKASLQNSAPPLTSFIKKSDYVFTKLKIEPNTITFFNNLIITPLLLYELYCNYYLVSILFIWIRAYFDALDGYIARKYNKCSKEAIDNHKKYFSEKVFLDSMEKILC